MPRIIDIKDLKTKSLKTVRELNNVDRVQFVRNAKFTDCSFIASEPRFFADIATRANEIELARSVIQADLDNKESVSKTNGERRRGKKKGWRELVKDGDFTPTPEDLRMYE